MPAHLLVPGQKNHYATMRQLMRRRMKSAKPGLNYTNTMKRLRQNLRSEKPSISESKFTGVPSNMKPDEHFNATSPTMLNKLTSEGIADIKSYT